MSDDLLAGKFQEGNKVIVDAEDGKIALKVGQKEQEEPKAVPEVAM